MTDRNRGSGFGRAIAVLAIVALGVMVAAPAFSAKLTKSKVKTIAQKQALKVLKQQLDDQGNPIFIEEGKEVVLIPVTQRSTVGSTTLATVGPLTFKGIENNPGGTDLECGVTVSTTEDNSVLYTYATNEDDFDAADGDITWVFNDTGAAPDPSAANQALYNYDGRGFVATPTGVAVDGSFAVAANFDGAHCTFFGNITVSSG